MSGSCNPASSKIPPTEFHAVMSKIRAFFLKRGYIEGHYQNCLDILLACEDPWNISTFEIGGKKYPQIQSAQLAMEYDLLSNPDIKGIFCVSTSYRDEKNRKEGRHDYAFPLVEFEARGTMEDLVRTEMDLLEHLGYDRFRFQGGKYDSVAQQYGVKELDHAEEAKMCESHPVFFLTDFPEFTDPFWNMGRYVDCNGELKARKVDVILSGMETFGSAERECDPKVMRERFESIVNGDFKRTLFEKFGEDRVMEEVNRYLSLDFVPRFGAGIGLTRLIKSMKKEGLL